MSSHFGASAHNTVQVLDDDEPANAVDLSSHDGGLVDLSAHGEMDEAEVFRLSRQSWELERQRRAERDTALRREEEEIARAQRLSLQEGEARVPVVPVVPDGRVASVGPVGLISVEADEQEEAGEAAAQDDEPQFQAEEIKRAEELSLQEQEQAPPLAFAAFKRAVEEWANAQGGWQGMDHGSVVAEGNMGPGSAKSKGGSGNSGATGGVGGNQGRAQYGRYRMEAFDRLLALLEPPRGSVGGSATGGAMGRRAASGARASSGGCSSRCASTPASGSMPAPAPVSASTSESVAHADASASHDRSPRHGRRIRAFVDIGHGLGVQVLQVGLTRKVPSRGIEIQSGRQMMAKELFSAMRDHRWGGAGAGAGMGAGSRSCPPPSFQNMKLIQGDFTKAVHGVSDLPPAEVDALQAECWGEEMTTAQIDVGKPRHHFDDATGRDTYMRKFLLCRDLPAEAQEGLVIFVNNFNGVFDDRADTRGNMPTLDAQLAHLFTNMRVGGRMVLLHKISKYLHQNGQGDWYELDTIDSGKEAVSWSGLALPIFVYTKTADQWTCRHPNCDGRQLFEGKPLKVQLVADDESIKKECPYCDNQVRTTRHGSGVRRSGKRKRTGDGAGAGADAT